MEQRVIVTLKGKIFEGKAPEITQKAIGDFMSEATSFLEREVRKRTPRGVYGAQGGLLSTIHGEVVGRGTPIVKGIVAHGSLYGDVIELGRRAGKKWPPEGVLVRWIQLKMGVSEVEAKRLEFVIRRKIGRKGFPGVQMFEEALTVNLAKLKDMADRYGLEIAQELNA